MRFILNSDGKSFHSLVVAALVNEANKERKPIELEHRLMNGFVADVYLPKGLSIFGTDDKAPYVVEIKESFKRRVDDQLFAELRFGFKGTLFLITQDILPPWETHQLFKERFRLLNVKVLGADFVNDLLSRNPDAYLNYALGDEKSLLTSPKGNSLFLRLNEKGRGNRKSISSERSEIEYQIKEGAAEKLSKENERVFKAYLNEESAGSKCALIIGNGVSIPFGSDGWSSMTKNLLNLLEPFHIEKGDHVEEALSKSSYAISSFVKTMLTKKEGDDRYFNAIRYCIYRKYNEIMHDQDSLVNVIAKAKAKYENLPLLTYNYDTFVEKQYFYNQGGILNYYRGDDSDKDSIDAICKDKVLHLHGYISYEKNKHKGVVLTDDEYFKAYSKNSWTYRMQVQALTNYVCLFVGSSMSDLFQMSLIQEAKQNRKSEKWNCFALMCFQGLGFKEKMEILKYYGEKGIRIIFENDFNELPNALKRLFNI